ncbi:MAG: hypothetical protein AAGK21_00070 [Bacteroidota bacterium]
MPGPGDFCHGCNRLLCRCLPEPDPEMFYEEAYQAGYEACLADGYSERPMTEWIYVTGQRATWDAEARGFRYVMTPLRFAELTWRHRFTSAGAYAQWFERQVGHDLEAYLAGFDDAGAGLPSEVTDPEHHARCEDALDGYGPLPETPEPSPDLADPACAVVHDDDWLPF